jgi:hypothetical protein
MIRTLVRAVEHPAETVAIVDVPGIRGGGGKQGTVDG